VVSLSLEGTQPPLVDVREHRFQLGVVGVLTLLLTGWRRPRSIVALAALSATPVLPFVFRRLLAAQLGPTTSMEDARLPAFARIAGGAGLALAAGAAVAAPSRVADAALVAASGVCLYGAATGRCLPCSTLLMLEDRGLVVLDPPLVCAMR
jgi:hypothetical protein